jgi:hypothetical protein
MVPDNPLLSIKEFLFKKVKLIRKIVPSAQSKKKSNNLFKIVKLLICSGSVKIAINGITDPILIISKKEVKIIKKKIILYFFLVSELTLEFKKNKLDFNE